MKIWKISLVALSCAALLLQGCKKNSEDTKLYLSGSLSLSVPAYVSEGFTKSFCIDTLMTVTRGDGGKIGYYFKDPATSVYDTLIAGDGTVRKKVFSFEVPDTLGNLSLTLGAFTTDGVYYGTSTSKTFTVVKAGLDGKGSITGFMKSLGDKVYTDTRDGRKYFYTNIGGTDWMRQNLAWEGAGHAYGGCDVMSDIFGRYYSWTEAQTACPDGWTLPSDADWVALGAAFGKSAEAGKDLQGLAGSLMRNLYFNGTRMWEFWRDVKITDKSGLSVMPSGYMTCDSGKFENKSLYKYAAFWTSDSENGSGVLRYIYHDKDIVYRGLMSQTDFASTVRCVRK